MCSIRGLWLLDKSGEVLLSRKFSTVERRVRLRHETRDGENKNRKYLSYDEIAVPDNKEFSTLLNALAICWTKPRVIAPVTIVGARAK